MTIQIYDDLIYFIRFKNLKLAMDFDICVFLGEIKDNRIELNVDIERFLLKKFKINKFDSFTKNLVHIKFLAKYSPILSKFINFEEFNSIKIQRKDYKSIAWGDVYYIKFNNGLKFFNTEEINFDAETLYINMVQKLLMVVYTFSNFYF